MSEDDLIAAREAECDVYVFLVQADGNGKPGGLTVATAVPVSPAPDDRWHIIVSSGMFTLHPIGDIFATLDEAAAAGVARWKLSLRN